MTGAGIANDRNKECSAAAMTQKAPTCAAHDHNRNAVETSAACTRHGCRVAGTSGKLPSFASFTRPT